MCRDDPELHFSSSQMLRRMDLFLASQGMGFNAGTERRRRLHDAYALDALSDCQLASLGLTRDQIPAYVFADLLG